MAKTVIGLDVGSWSIKAAVLESTLRGFTLVDVREHHIPRGPSGEIAPLSTGPAVRAVLRDIKEWDAIASAVPGKRVLVRELTLPFTDDKRIRSILGFQLEDLLPFDLEDLVYDYYRVGNTEDGGAKLLCAAVERSWLTEHLRELEEADAAPKILTLETLAFPHLLNQLGGGTPSAAVAMVDLGHATTSVAVVRNGVTQAVRTISGGGHHITMAIMKALDLDYGEAERLKHHAVRFDGAGVAGIEQAVVDKVAKIAWKALEPVLRDLRLTLHAYANQHDEGVSELLVFGGTSQIPGIEESVSGALGLPTRRPDVIGAPWSQVPAGSTAAVSSPASVALALRFVGGGAADSLDFRQGDFAHESDYKAIRDRAGWLLLMAAVLVMAFFGRQYAHYKGLEKNHAALVAQLSDYSSTVLGKEDTDFEHVLDTVKNPLEAEAEEVFPEVSAFKAFLQVTTAQDAVNAREVGGQPGVAPGPRDPSPPGVGDDEEATADGVPLEPGDTPVPERESGYKVELKQVQIDTKTAFIKGEANNIEAVEAFTGELKRNVCFRAVETNDTTRISFGDRQDWLRFQLKIDIGCQKPVEEKPKEKPKADKPAAGGGE
ncbi:MAG: pilus assembly protein PilM [Myxococcota bacterium]